MQERLIEHWLDSINERAYQSAFLQMLSGEGHIVVHSTRHMAIEFGKDVVSIDADGVPCAFQLKGNPRGRLTLNQFREMKPQLDELVEQRIVYPGIPDIPHKCFIVTNGEVEEEVQRAVDDLNFGYEKRGFHKNQRLRIISRGMLLDFAIKHSTSFWTDSFSIHEKIIRLYNEDGRKSARLDIISEGLDEILKISPADEALSKIEFERRQISASLFVSFGIRNYENLRNHIAVSSAYAALFVALECSRQRHSIFSSARADMILSIARQGFFDSAIELADEIGKNIDHLQNERSDGKPIDYNVMFLTSPPLSDNFLWRPRALMTSAILSLISIERNNRGNSDGITDDAAKAIEFIIKPGLFTCPVFGEFFIPQLLCVIFNLHKTDPSMLANFSEHGLLKSILSQILRVEGGYIASPYHNAEDTIRDFIGNIIDIDKGPVGDEVTVNSSYFAEALFYCFVRSNLKSYAKDIWVNLTKVSHLQFLPKNSWDYFQWRAASGDNQTRILERRRLWSDVQKEASNIDTPNIPPRLRDDPVMLLAFIVFFPHRGIPEVVKFLHFSLCGTWFLPTERPPR